MSTLSVSGPRGISGGSYGTTNSIQHERGEIQRRTILNDANLLRLGTALALECNEQWMERRYLDAAHRQRIPDPRAVHAEGCLTTITRTIRFRTQFCT